MRKGFGVGYHPNGQIKYMGEWKDKVPSDGQVTLLGKDGKLGYVGEMVSGKT